MSQPRQIVPGTTYAIQRRTTHGERWFVPNVFIERLFIFLFAVAAKMFDIEIHAACVMSNHYHAVITDTHGRLPDFLHWVNLMTFNCIREKYGGSENLWQSGEPSYQALCDAEAVLDAMTYCISNAVKHGAVKASRLWPGLVTRPKDMLGTTYEAARPDVFFSSTGTTPASASFTVTRPPILAHLSDAELADLISRRLYAAEKRLRRIPGQTFMGPELVLKQKIGSRPANPYKGGGGSPRFKASTVEGRAVAFRIQRQHEAAHAEARGRFADGHRDVLFPYGTYAWRRFAGVRVARSGTAIADAGRIAATGPP